MSSSENQPTLRVITPTVFQSQSKSKNKIEEIESDSDDGYTKNKIEKLTRNNWHEWRIQLENLLILKGYEELLDSNWNNINMGTLKFRKQNAWGINLLYTSVSKELRSTINKNSKSFFDCFNALSTACGQKSIVIICEKLFKLLSIIYQPGSSLSDHLTLFQDHYIALTTSLDQYNDFMTISTSMAGAFLLRSLHLDESLNSLVTSLYDLNIFSFETIYDRLMIEDNRRENNLTSNESSYFTQQQRRFNQNNQQNSQFNNRNNNQNNRGISRGFGRGGFRGIPRGLAPTRNYQQQHQYQHSNQIGQQSTRTINKDQVNNQQLNNNIDNDHIQRLINQTIKRMNLNKNDELNNVENNDNDDVEGFILNEDELNISINHESKLNTLIFDSGATKSTLCNFDLLIDPTPIKKQMNTYGNSINITHIGKFDFNGMIIYPVYYAPNGPRNLISASQLEDHGLTITHKHNTFIIKLGQKIMKTFSRVGDLYTSTYKRRPLYSINQTNNNLLLNSSVKIDENKDWHVILGHPSDLYLKKFFDLNNIKQKDASYASNCEICKSVKLKKTPHNNPL